MFGLDESIAGLSDGVTVWLVVVIGILLGLRHAADPDHLAAMTTLVAGGRDRAARSAGRLGFAWGLGHATTLFAFGLPIVLFNEYLPERVQAAAETAIGFIVVYLAVRLLLRWRRGAFHLHEHRHGEVSHAHLHAHAEGGRHGHPHKSRSPLGAYGIGLVHGMGGSAGVSVLILASIESTTLAVISLALLAVFTAVSMTTLTTGFGLTLVSRPVRASFDVVAPALGFTSVGFGIWYGAAAWSLAPYPF
jgi:ABC-type nickel/cobalt efflux system permease component RcnA